MNQVALVAAVAAVTAGSRIAALALLPAPRGRMAEIIGRLPAPLFAALAAVSLVGAETGPSDAALLLAVGCALAATPRRSLLIIVLAGLVGFVAGDLLR